MNYQPKVPLGQESESVQKKDSLSVMDSKLTAHSGKIAGARFFLSIGAIFTEGKINRHKKKFNMNNSYIYF
jgi:hypothetical protein